jgi:hypothetical protein
VARRRYPLFKRRQIKRKKKRKGGKPFVSHMHPLPLSFLLPFFLPSPLSLHARLLSLFFLPSLFFSPLCHARTHIVGKRERERERDKEIERVVLSRRRREKEK